MTRRALLLGLALVASLAAGPVWAPVPAVAQPYVTLMDALAGFDALHQAASDDPSLRESRDWRVAVIDVLSSAVEAAVIAGEPYLLEAVRLFAVDYTDGILYADDYLILRALAVRAGLPSMP